MELPQQRKGLIERITSDLHRDYDVKNLDELRRASENNGIAVIQNNKVIIPSAVYHNASAKWFILTRNHLFETLGLTCFAHEMGHAFLDHRDATLYEQSISKEQAETEAEYFQKQLGYEKFPKIEMVLDALCTLSTQPLTSTRWILSPSFQRDHDRKLISEYLEHS